MPPKGKGGKEAGKGGKETGKGAKGGKGLFILH